MTAYSWPRIGLAVLLLATAGGLAITIRLADAPAWWQAILSAAAVFTTAILWRLDKDRSRAERDQERLTLTAIVAACLAKIRGAARDLHDLQATEAGTHVSHSDLEASVLAIRHRWEHLALFSPYDRLGDFEMVAAVADVDAVCRKLVGLLEPPSPRRLPNPEMASFLPPRYGLTRLSRSESQEIAAELIELSTRAIRTLRSRTS